MRDIFLIKNSLLRINNLEVIGKEWKDQVLNNI